MTQTAAILDRPAPTTPFVLKPLQLALLVLGLYCGFVAMHLQRHHGDITSFIVAGDKFADVARLTDPIAVQPNSPGYDGLFYYRLGRDPFTTAVTAFGITLDNPATRMQRFGYPLLAWVVSFGQAAWLPWALVGLNLAGLFSIAWIGTNLARRHGLPPWLGLAPALYPGFVVSLERDTTEIVAISFAFAALFFALERKYWRAMPFAVCAVLTRETTLLYLAGFGLVEAIACLRHRRWSWDLVALAVPAVVFVVWQSSLIALWGASSYSGTAQNLGMPFDGLARFYRADIAALRSAPWSYDFKRHAYDAVAASMWLVVGGLALVAVIKGRAPGGLKLAWFFYAALVSCFTTAIWVQPYDFLRGCSDCFIVGATVILLSWRGRAMPLLLVFIAPIWVMAAWMG